MVKEMLNICILLLRFCPFPNRYFITTYSTVAFLLLEFFFTLSCPLVELLLKLHGNVKGCMEGCAVRVTSLEMDMLLFVHRWSINEPLK